MKVKKFNQPEENLIPMSKDNIAVIDNLNLKENFSFPITFEEIHKLRPINKKNTIAETKNKPALENKVIKNTCEKPKALNHKKSVYIVTTVDTNIKIIIVNHINRCLIVFIKTSYYF